MIALFVGTRPEVIKMAPVAKALGDRGMLIGIEQQKNMLEDCLNATLLPYTLWRPDTKKHLPAMFAALVKTADSALRSRRPELVLVQGDTQTALAAAQQAFLHEIPVGHVEAGLRTNAKTPFPEEMNRRLISQIATLHFCPTVLALYNLRREQLANEHTFVTGNTSVDALQAVLPDALEFSFWGQILVTCHRRESLNTYLPMLVEAVKKIRADKTLPDVLWPVHPNPVIQKATKELDCTVRPLYHAKSVGVMAGSPLVITDSGGVVEEATTLGRRVLVLREETERPEAERVGAARRILLSDMPYLYEIVKEELATQHKPKATDVFGDGKAAERIAKACLKFLGDVNGPL